jgi:hypothetical protein
VLRPKKMPLFWRYFIFFYEWYWNCRRYGTCIAVQVLL